ncbi:MAG: DNA/RNA nuclease SfsA [Caldithrix sp.]|nr:DNA/RNA nuclease SfsA [Caldithrix sp.]
MRFTDPLISGVLLKRYKRFLADFRLDNGQVITVHCPNSGSMKTCKTPGWQGLLSDSKNPKRKHRYTWEMIHNGRTWIGINTNIPNRIAEEAIADGAIPELRGYQNIRKEVKYGNNSRIDLLLENGEQKCYVEVKNVTLVEEDGFYKFPDAVTERGRKHLYELLSMKKAGNRAVMLYVVQRNDGTIFKPAVDIDANYAQALREAHRNGVEILVYQAEVNPNIIYIKQAIQYSLD